MSDIKSCQSKKTKSIKRIIVASILAASFIIAFFAATNAIASSSDSQNCNNNLVFSLAVNGTLQTTQVVNLNLGPQTSSSSYREIYTLTNQANTPITITATTTLSPSNAATLTWQGGTTVNLLLGASSKMTLTLTGFTSAGTASVTFKSSCYTPPPTPTPTPCPTPKPTPKPTPTPTATPKPTPCPTPMPKPTPTPKPTATPTPTPCPTAKPTPCPTAKPTPTPHPK